MERKYKITIPEPCNEDWNKMTPNELGRFCGSCSKNVVDFTNMLPNEIQIYFQQNTNVCGRFKKSQLDSITIQIPHRVLYSQTHYHKMFLLALFIAMGTTLFSCADKNGNKQKIDKVEIIEDTIQTNHKTAVNLPNTDSIQRENTGVWNSKYDPNSNQPPRPKKNICNNITATTGIIMLAPVPNKKGEANNRPNIIYEDNTIYGGVGINVYPEYAGGIINFNKYIIENFIFSKKSKRLDDTIIANFVIEKDGKLDSISVLKDIGFGTKEELVRVLSNAKKWYPGEEYGKKRNCKFQISLKIRPDSIKKTIFATKIASKIDTIEIKRITKYKGD